METVRVELGSRSYPIYIGGSLLDRHELVGPYLQGRRVAVVTNRTVAPLYLERVAATLAARGLETVPIVVPDGESYKSLETLAQVYDRLLDTRCDRQTPVVALGGGVIGDLAGFAAATYQRGVPFIQVPTTLLAQVDSSVGGKTAVNHPRGKNMIGAFYQPLAVFADVDTLASLPDRELRAGLAEVIKHGLIRDVKYFEWIEEHVEELLGRETGALVHAVRRSCEIKAEVVAQDERETGPRALLNFGHTFGHAVETATGFGTWLHGEAVAVGMVMAAKLTCRLGGLAEHDVRRIVALLQRAGLPVRVQGIPADRFLDLMSVDKKVASGRIRFVLLNQMGSAVVRDDVPRDDLEAILSGHG